MANTSISGGNQHMGKHGLCYFDDISMEKLAPRPKKLTPFQAGPFTPGNEGFLTHWLVCGPYPNPQLEVEDGFVFHGHRNDLLAHGAAIVVDDLEETVATS